MKIKTSELIGAALDYAVSLITNPEWSEEDRAFSTYDYIDIGDPDDEPYMPSENWAQGGPIIEHACIGLDHYPDGGHPQGGEWGALTNEGTVESFGPTPLIAAMRCYVASKLGDEVDVPDVLTK